MTALVVAGGLLVLGGALGLGLAFGMHYWSRDEVILRARRREQRRLARARARRQAEAEASYRKRGGYAATGEVPEQLPRAPRGPAPGGRRP